MTTEAHDNKAEAEAKAGANYTILNEVHATMMSYDAIEQFVNAEVDGVKRTLGDCIEELHIHPDVPVTMHLRDGLAVVVGDGIDEFRVAFTDEWPHSDVVIPAVRVLPSEK